MTEEIIESERKIELIKHLEDELQLYDVQDARIKNRLERLILQSTAYLLSLVGELKYTKKEEIYIVNHAKYAYYGILNEFDNNYRFLLREIQIENY